MATEKSNLEGTSKAPEKVSAVSANDEPTETKGSVLGERKLKRGDKGEDVAALQRKLGLVPSGNYNEETERRVSYLRRVVGLGDGSVDTEFLRLIK